MLELFDEDFKASVIKMLQWSITNSLETRGKQWNILTKKLKFKKESTANYKLKNTITNSKKISLMFSVIEWR